MSEASNQKSNEVVRTSEVIAQDGMEVVGDSTRRMEILREARQKGKLVEDGYASDIFEKIKKAISDKITS